MTPVQFATVPKLFPGETIAILASGPSLTEDDVHACRGRARILAIKDSVRLEPDADILYACDAKWWKHHGPKLSYDRPRYALEIGAAPWASVLRNTGELGLEAKPDGLRTGRNSGFQAINLAVHLGAARIVLLGYDMGPRRGKHHWFGVHPYPASAPPYDIFLRCFDSLIAPLKSAGVSVVNCTPGSSLRTFPMRPLCEALEQGVAA